MRLYLTAKVKELNLSYLQFMEICHYWKFGRDVIPQEDYAQFMLHGVIPRYCVEFLVDMQEKERDTCRQYSAQNVARLSPPMQWSNSALPSVLGKQ